MRFVVERDALAEAVAWIARSLPSRPVLPVLSGLLLQAAPGALTLSCFDYEVSARVGIDAEVAEPGMALVPGRLLAEITRSLPGHPVEVDDADDVTLTCGPASFSLVTLPIADYPRLPELPRLAGTVDGGVFATAVGQVTPAASRDDTLPVITGVNLEIEGDTITLVATDRYRLAIRELGWHPARPAGPQHAAGPGQDAGRRGPHDGAGRPGPDPDARHGRGHPGQGHRRRPGGLAARGRRHDRVRIGGAKADHAPDRGRLHQVQLEVPGGLRQLRRHAGRAARRGGQAGGAGRRARQLGPAVLRAGEGHHRGRDQGQARARETVAADFSGDEAAIAFSPQYLLDGLAAALAAASGGPPAPDPSGPGRPERDAAPAPAEGRIRLQFTSPTKPALITGSSGADSQAAPDYRYLVVPLRSLASA